MQTPPRPGISDKSFERHKTRTMPTDIRCYAISIFIAIPQLFIMMRISETPRLGAHHAVCLSKRRNTRHLSRARVQTRQRRHARRRKIGSSWALREASVYDRLSKKPSAGRPPRTTDSAQAETQPSTNDLRDLYLECKRAFQFEPSLQAIEEAKARRKRGSIWRSPTISYSTNSAS